MSEQGESKTQVAFHFNAPDKLDYACRFVRKAMRREVPVTVVAPMELLRQLSARLWKLAGQDFLAHAVEGDDDAIFALSPVVLVSRATLSQHRALLLNLGTAVPEGFEAFDKLVEVVSSWDDEDRQCARQRWRHYQQLGHAIERHDLVLNGGS